jgi:uncharacterized protein YdeI (YjbR/CyaY-like superfamily)
MNPKVEFYFSKSEKWQNELRALRTIILGCELTEELKWGVPCYTFQKSNVLLIHEFKEYCAILFMKGALLNNTDGILIQQTENVQAARQIRFTNIEQITKVANTIKAYIYEAIEIEKAGLKVELKKPSEFKIAEEFQQKLDDNPDLKTAFSKLKAGRQRAYLLHFSSPKQPKTREARVEKVMDAILLGKGLNE